MPKYFFSPKIVPFLR